MFTSASACALLFTSEELTRDLTQPIPTMNNNDHDPVFVPVGNFSRGFVYRPRPVSEHPCVCECEGCRQTYAERLIEMERIKKIYGV